MNYAEGTFERAGELRGKDVRVSLDDDGLGEGRLLTYDDMGGVTVVDEGGAVHRCWPLLKIEAVLTEGKKF